MHQDQCCILIDIGWSLFLWCRSWRYLLTTSFPSRCWSCQHQCAAWTWVPPAISWLWWMSTTLSWSMTSTVKSCFSRSVDRIKGMLDEPYLAEFIIQGAVGWNKPETYICIWLSALGRGTQHTHTIVGLCSGHLVSHFPPLPASSFFAFPVGA